MSNPILFFDLETSGLDPQKHVIYEVAAIVVDEKLDPVAGFSRVVTGDIELMDDYVHDMHVRSGLIDEIPHGDSIYIVEDDLVKFCDRYFSESIVLAGHSIHFDRKFVDRHMPRFASGLSYRLLDVGAIARFVKQCVVPHGIEFTDGNTKGHRALADAEGAREEFQRAVAMVSEHAKRVAALERFVELSREGSR